MLLKSNLFTVAAQVILRLIILQDQSLGGGVFTVAGAENEGVPGIAVMFADGDISWTGSEIIDDRGITAFNYLVHLA